jgi:FkbM family methyltransferase
MSSPAPPPLSADGFNEVVAGRHGLFVFHRHDQYVGASLRKYGEFSPGEARLFAQLLTPGQTVVEAGANFGAHTVELSRLVGGLGRVYAFEPQRLVFQALCANLALNSCANVFAYQVALGANAGEITVPAHSPERAGNFGGVSLIAASGGERVPLRTIDELRLAACHLLKVDVEGMEAEVLRGAAETIRRHRPLLYVENDRVERSAGLIALLLSWNYRLYWHMPPLYERDNFFGDQENLFPGIVSINMFGVPLERDLAIEDGRRITSVDDTWGSAVTAAPLTLAARLDQA